MGRMLANPMAVIMTIACLIAGIAGLAMVIASSRRDSGGGASCGGPAPRGAGAEPTGEAMRACPRCYQFSPSYAKFCAHCGRAFDVGD